MSHPTTRPADTANHENEDRKPGSPPRSANEPRGSEGSSETTKTRTDPHTGAPNPGRPDTAG